MLSDLGFSYFGVSGFLLDTDSSEKKNLQAKECCLVVLVGFLLEPAKYQLFN